MKKTSLYISLAIALATSIGFTAIISSVAATQPNTSQNILATSTDLATDNPTKLNSRNESVYIITNSAGAMNSSFVGNTINTSSEPLPLKMHITYRLDGKEIAANELAGKSGHVEITYTFTPTKYYQNKFVPFLTVTGLALDNNKFNNVKIDHGKILSDKEDTILLAGYALVGLNENLNTDFLPSQFTVTADVQNFELATTYTFATNEPFAEFDTTKLTSIDDLVNSVNDLDSAFSRIVNGASDLTKGNTDLATGANRLNQGAHDLATGADQLAAGTTDLATGANQLAQGTDNLATGATNLAAGADQLATGMNQLVDFNTGVVNKIDTTETEITATIQTLIQQFNIDPNSELIKNLNTQLKSYYTTAHTAVTTYTGNIEKLAAGASQLDQGANTLAAGASQLNQGAHDLATGANQLNQGAHNLATGANQLAQGTTEFATGANQLATGSQTLHSGLLTFKQQGIDRLVNFANRDLASFTANLRSTVVAADSYHHYSNPAAKSVKFIFKTPNIK